MQDLKDLIIVAVNLNSLGIVSTLKKKSYGQRMTMPGIDLPEGCGIPLTGDTMCCSPVPCAVR